MSLLRPGRKRSSVEVSVLPPLWKERPEIKVRGPPDWELCNGLTAYVREINPLTEAKLPSVGYRTEFRNKVLARGNGYLELEHVKGTRFIEEEPSRNSEQKHKTLAAYRSCLRS